MSCLGKEDGPGLGALPLQFGQADAWTIVDIVKLNSLDTEAAI